MTLGDVVMDMDASEVEKFIVKGSEILGLQDTPPVGILQYNLDEEYRLMQRPEMGDAPKLVKGYFDTIEGNASWVVLREIGESDDTISQYSREERLRKFVNELYQNPEKFKFFEDREKALENLDSLGIISMQDYRAS